MDSKKKVKVGIPKFKILAPPLTSGTASRQVKGRKGKKCGKSSEKTTGGGGLSIRRRPPADGLLLGEALTVVIPSSPRTVQDWGEEPCLSSGGNRVFACHHFREVFA